MTPPPAPAAPLPAAPGALRPRDPRRRRGAPGRWTGAPGDPPLPPVLLVTGDERLVEDVGRLAAAAGAVVAVVERAAQAAPALARAPLVLLGADALETGLPRRRAGAVVVATGGDASDDLWRRALEVGAEAVALLPHDERGVLARLAAASGPPARAGRVVGVVGGSGGVGASVLAAAVAVVAAADRSVLLVDADPLGGGADLLLGVDGDPGLRWDDLLAARGVLHPGVLREGLPVARGGARVLSFARTGAAGPPPDGLGAGAVDAVLEAAVASHDLVVVDLPRRDDPPTAGALWRLDLLLLVARVELRSLVAAAAVRDLAAGHVGDVRVVLRRARASGLSDVDAAEALGLPVLGRLDTDPGLVAALARGEAPGSAGGALARTARAVLGVVDDLGPAPVPGAPGGSS